MRANSEAGADESVKIVGKKMVEVQEQGARQGERPPDDDPVRSRSAIGNN